MFSLVGEKTVTEAVAQIEGTAAALCQFFLAKGESVSLIVVASLSKRRQSGLFPESSSVFLYQFPRSRFVSPAVRWHSRGSCLIFCCACVPG